MGPGQRRTRSAGIISDTGVQQWTVPVNTLPYLTLYMLISIFPDRGKSRQSRSFSFHQTTNQRSPILIPIKRRRPARQRRRDIHDRHFPSFIIIAITATTPPTGPKGPTYTLSPSTQIHIISESDGSGRRTVSCWWCTMTLNVSMRNSSTAYRIKPMVLNRTCTIARSRSRCRHGGKR